MPLHFAYGSNMDGAAMARRCPRARLRGRARLARWRLVVMPSGFVSVAPDPRASVHGVLWDVALADMLALDRYEQVVQGLYEKRLLPVLREPFGAASALTYVCVAPTQGAAAPGYLDDIVAAARTQGLAPDYLDDLTRLAAARRRGQG